MGTKKCGTNKEKNFKPAHCFTCEKCGHSAKKKEKLCKPKKLRTPE